MQPAAQSEKWLKVAANLRADRKHNLAPHKPLLPLVAAELVHDLDADGKQLRVVKLTDDTFPRPRERERGVANRMRDVGNKTRYTAEKVRTLCASPDELRPRWADAGQRNFSLSASNGERAGVRCRKLQLSERGIDRRKAKGQKLNAKVTRFSAFRLQPSAFPHVPPISQHGNVNEIIGKFGGADRLRDAVNKLQALLYAA
jgi:type I restriction enzyme R subunit